MKRIAAGLMVLALAGCGSDGAKRPSPGPSPAPAVTPAPKPLPPITSIPVPNPAPSPAPRPRPRPAPAQPAAPTAPADTCGAKALQSLVGKPRTAIPVPVDVRKRRVTCTTCPVTMDYAPERLNIFFDAQSGIIKEVKCG